MTKDPVCGTKVDENRSPTSTYGGKAFVFCGDDCKKAFDQDPEKYVNAGQREKVGKG
jgi:P-type Cu+ transporter